MTSQKGFQGSRNSQRSQRQIYFRPKTHGQHYYARQRTRIQLALLTPKTDFLVLLSKCSRSNVPSFEGTILMATRLRHQWPNAHCGACTKVQKRHVCIPFFELHLTHLYHVLIVSSHLSKLLNICIISCWWPIQGTGLII